MPRPTKVDWAAVEHDYVAGEETLVALAGRHGTTAATIRARASREGWPPRQRSRGRARPAPPVAGADLLADKRRLAHRLTSAIEKILMKMEKRMALEKRKEAEPASAADQERDSRMVHSLIRSLEKVTELEADLDRPDAGAGKPRAADARALADEAERFRRDIAQRLARLGGPAAA